MEILDNAKRVYDLIKKLNNLEILEAMATLREQIVQLREENVRLKEQAAALQQTQEDKTRLSWDGRVWWYQEPGREKIPVCPKCWTEKEKVCYMRDFKRQWGMDWHCQVCNSHFAQSTL